MREARAPNKFKGVTTRSDEHISYVFPQRDGEEFVDEGELEAMKGGGNFQL